MNPRIKNIFFISIPTFIIFFLLLEIGVRIFTEPINLYPIKDWMIRSPYASHTAKPGEYSGYYANFYNPSYQYLEKTVNSHGFISTPEINMKKLKNTVRVLFLGGSSTAGTGTNLSDQNTWPWKTIKILKSKYPEANIDFINGAHGGYSTWESYGRLWSRLRFFSPDIIVVYHGWNEMYYFNDKYVDNPMEWKKVIQVKSSKSLRSIAIWFLERFQVLIRIKHIRDKILLKSIERGEISEKLKLKSDFNHKGLGIFDENLSLIKNFCKTNNIRLFVCKQATLVRDNISEADKAKCMYEYHGFDHEAHCMAFKKIYDVIDTKFSPEEIIDVTFLTGISEYFYDAIHPTPKGTSEIAKIVADSLCNNYFKYR